MCGRFALNADAATVIQNFSLTRNIVLKPRYNIAPSQVIPVIRKVGELEFLTWGLKPKWLKADQSGFINARMETLHEKPAFRQAFKQQRCLIVADGYYEWKQIGKIKQPYFICMPHKQLFAFAGLWDADSCAIITKPADQPALINVHDRMPVMIAADKFYAWLDPKTEPNMLQACMLQSCATSLQIFPVSTKVNNPRNDFVECIQPLQ
jgi:putative SOS response-associated peptidase YedK